MPERRNEFIGSHMYVERTTSSNMYVIAQLDF